MYAYLLSFFKVKDTLLQTATEHKKPVVMLGSYLNGYMNLSALKKTHYISRRWGMYAVLHVRRQDEWPSYRVIKVAMYTIVLGSIEILLITRSCHFYPLASTYFYPDIAAAVTVAVH